MYIKFKRVIGIITAGILLQGAVSAEEELSVSKTLPYKYTVVAQKENNEGLYYDINAFRYEDIMEFLLPYSCDLSQVAVTVLDENNEELATDIVDFTDEDNQIIEVGEYALEMRGSSSELPVINMEIDEENGTIKAMNESEDHSVACYGDLTVHVPEKLAEEWDCDTVTTSVGNDEKEDTPGTFRLRGRGNSSWTTATDKQRPYQVKLEKGLSILGMEKNKDWALLRSEDNRKFLSNKICYDMAADFGIENTPGARMADVYLNGNYIGVYTVTNTVKVGKSSVPITDIDEQIGDGVDVEDIDITGGYLLEIDNFPETLQFGTNKNQITIKAPEELDTTVDEGSKYDYIRNLMSDLFDAVYGDGYMSDGRHFTEVLDMDSTVRYFLLQELTGNYDTGRGSTFFYKDTDSIDSKIYMGPVWDSDAAFEHFSNDWTLYHKGVTWLEADAQNYTFMSELCEHKEFVSYLKAYYVDNFKNNNIRNIYTEYAQKAEVYMKEIEKSALATSHVYDMADPDISYISSYIDVKSKFVDENILEFIQAAANGEEIVLCEGESDSTDVYVKGNKVYCSFENNSREEAEIMLLTYSTDGKLISVSEASKVIPGTKIYKNFELLYSGEFMFKVYNNLKADTFKTAGYKEVNVYNNDNTVIYENPPQKDVVNPSKGDINIRDLLNNR